MGKKITKTEKKEKKLPQHSSAIEKHKLSQNLEKSSVSKDKIVDYLYFCTHFESHMKEFKKTWKVTLEENLIFYKLDTSHYPRITISIKINKNLKVEAFTERGQIAEEELKHLLNSPPVLKNWSQFKNLLKYFENEVIIVNSSEKREEFNSGSVHVQTNVKKNKIEHNLHELLKYMEIFENVESKEVNNFKAKLEFILNQIDALLYNEYTPNFLSKACLIYLKSSSCYEYLQRTDFFTLPSEEKLLKYIFDTNAINVEMDEE